MNPDRDFCNVKHGSHDLTCDRRAGHEGDHADGYVHWGPVTSGKILAALDSRTDEPVEAGNYAELEERASAAKQQADQVVIDPVVFLTLLRRLASKEWVRDEPEKVAAPLGSWDDEDRPLPEDDQIRAAHPVHSDSHATYAEAMRLVGAKRSKAALVDLVNWLLVQLAHADARMAALSHAGNLMRDEFRAHIENLQQALQTLAHAVREERSAPWFEHPDKAAELDEALAKADALLEPRKPTE